MVKVVYYSRGGNTQKLANAIAKGAGVSSCKIDEYDSKGDCVDLMFLGASIYAGKIDKKMLKFLQELDNVKNVVVFSTAAGKKTPLNEISQILNQKNIKVSEKEYSTKGSFLLANRNRPNAEDLLAAEEFAKGIVLSNG